MPRRKLPARLVLREWEGRKPLYYIVHDGREYSTGCGIGDEQGANEKLGLYIARSTKPDTKQRDPEKIWIADVMTLYMKDVAPEKAAPALIGYHAKALLGFFGKKSLGDINGSLCRDYWKARGKQVSLSTVRRELTTLQAAINYWHGESPLQAVPRIVKPSETPARNRFLSRTEAARLLKAARALKLDYIARFILIGLYTGTRHDAILGLRWYPSEDSGWLDADAGIIYRMGTAEKKTKKQRTPARIPDRLLAHVRRWARNDLGAGPQTAVIRWKGQAILKERRAWQRVVTEAKLHWMEKQPDGTEKWKTDVTPHTLKHTCITWLMNSRMTHWDIAGLTATSLKTIEAVYGHHSPDFQTEVAGAFRRKA